MPDPTPFCHTHAAFTPARWHRLWTGAALLTGLTLAACASPSDTAAPPRSVVYDCDTGGPVTLHWPEGAHGPAVLTAHNGHAVTLLAQPAASGFAYAQGPIVVMGKGREIRITHGRMVPQRCTAR